MKRIYILSFVLCFVLAPAVAQSLRTGAERMEVLLPLLEGKRVALTVNQTSVVGPQQTHLLDTLLARKVDVRKIFAPEHGFRGNADAGETVRNGKDVKSGLPILSLYGKNKKPSAAQLADVDILLFDIQDVGARFYTYISTMHYLMEACAEHGKTLIVTDRPNPCDYVDGPIREKAFQSFVGMHPIPVLHGCTVGELARMINGEGWLQGGKQCRLTVVPMEGWKHGQPYSLPVKPSPNLPNDRAIALYPSLCPFEGTSVSVGRGTYMPFQIFGSPHLPKEGFRFRPKALEGFDKNPMHKDQDCFGKDLRTGEIPSGFSLTYVIECYHAYKKNGKTDLFFNRASFFDLLMGTRSVRQQIIAGKDEQTIREQWKEGLEAYQKTRTKYLIYNH